MFISLKAFKKIVRWVKVIEETDIHSNQHVHSSIKFIISTSNEDELFVFYTYFVQSWHQCSSTLIMVWVDVLAERILSGNRTAFKSRISKDDITCFDVSESRSIAMFIWPLKSVLLRQRTKDSFSKTMSIGITGLSQPVKWTTSRIFHLTGRIGGALTRFFSQ